MIGGYDSVGMLYSPFGSPVCYLRVRRYGSACPAANAGMNWDTIRLLVSHANGTARYPTRRGTVERGAPIKDCGKGVAVSS
jgi:hypothetical protein